MEVNLQNITISSTPKNIRHKLSIKNSPTPFNTLTFNKASPVSYKLSRTSQSPKYNNILQSHKEGSNIISTPISKRLHVHPSPRSAVKAAIKPKTVLIKINLLTRQ